MLEKIREGLKENKKIIWIILSIICIIGFNMTIDTAKNTINFNGNQIIWLMLCVLFYFIFKYSSKLNNKRLIICSIILGIILAVFQTLGNVTKGGWISNEVIFSKKIILFIFIKLVVYTIIFSKIISIIFSYFENLNLEETNKKDIFKPNLKCFIIVAVILFIAWLPYFLNCYPGITSYDTNYQLMQGYGVYDLTNHHPVLHTQIITFLVKLGYSIAGNYNFGIAICSILQMIACSLTFSYIIYYMAKKQVPFSIKLITFLLFAFNPIVPQLSIAIWKDIPFTLLLTWFVIGIIEMITNEEKFFKSKIKLIIYAVIITLIMFFKNNGIYIILLTLPFVLIAKRKYWIKILIAFVVPIIFYYIMTGVGYEKLNIIKGSSKEMLSIPVQQMARVTKYRIDELTEEEKNAISEYLPINEIGELYRPTISDNIKNILNENAYEQDKLNFFKLYIKLAIHFPGETLEAFVGNTYGYYYPEVVTFPVAVGTYTQVFEEEKFMDIHTDPIIEIPFLDNVINSIYNKEIPIVSLLGNIGFVFWIFLILLMYTIYKKKYQYLLMYVPIIILYLTCIASPVSGELRYIYGMFTCMPLLLGFTIKTPSTKKHIYN